MTIPERPDRKPIRYVPPSDEVFDKFAQDMYAALAAKRNDPSIVNPELVRDFAQFLSLIARLHAGHLTSEAERIAQGAKANDPEAALE